jgi:hypothetical protein
MFLHPTADRGLVLISQGTVKEAIKLFFAFKQLIGARYASARVGVYMDMRNRLAVIPTNSNRILVLDSAAESLKTQDCIEVNYANGFRFVQIFAKPLCVCRGKSAHFAAVENLSASRSLSQLKSLEGTLSPLTRVETAEVSSRAGRFSCRPAIGRGCREAGDDPTFYPREKLEKKEKRYFTFSGIILHVTTKCGTTCTMWPLSRSRRAPTPAALGMPPTSMKNSRDSRRRTNGTSKFALT